MLALRRIHLLFPFRFFCFLASLEPLSIDKPACPI